MPPFVYSPHLSYWRSLDWDIIDPYFLRYWSRGPEFVEQLEGMKASTDMAPYLSLTDQRRLRISLPVPNEQRAIGSVLGALDEKIGLNRRMNRTLETTTAALFQSWFVDFDPVVAKADGRRAVGVSDRVHEAVPERLVDTNEQVIPEGWTLHRLGDLLTLAYGKSLPERVRKPGTVPVFGSDGQTGWHNKALVAGPGIIVGRKGNAGCVNWVADDFFAIDTTYFVELRDDRVPMIYAFYALATLDLKMLTGDSAVPGLNRELAYSMSMIRPPDVLMIEFERVGLPMRSRIAANESENRILADLRDTLLPKLLSGAIRLDDAERAVAALA
jgi:type I restriction enzyme S subunit